MVQIAYALPPEREEIAQFMCAAFPKAKWDIDGWRRVLDGRWGGDAPYAVTVRDKGVLVGVLGLISATRMTKTGLKRTMNMTSWYVLKSHRGTGLGSQMLALITADPDVTVTNYSSAKGAVPVVERAGFKALDSQRFVWKARSHSSAIDLVENPSIDDPNLTSQDRQILKDHQGLNLQSRLVKTPDGWCFFMFMIKQKHDEYLTYETMHVSRPDLFARCARAIADQILPETGAVLSVDSRFILGDVTPDAIENFAVPRFFTSGAMPPIDVDHLYSEIVLLDMKMY